MILDVECLMHFTECEKVSAAFCRVGKRFDHPLPAQVRVGAAGCDGAPAPGDARRARRDLRRGRAHGQRAHYAWVCSRPAPTPSEGQRREPQSLHTASITMSTGKFSFAVELPGTHALTPSFESHLDSTNPAAPRRGADGASEQRRQQRGHGRLLVRFHGCH